MVGTPIPHSLKSEAKKAAKILRDFTMPSAKTGPDKIIPAHAIANAEGLAILSVFKLGFLVTARGGSGIVIARKEDGSWSAPSAIGIAGLGGGFEIGAEVTDFVFILNKRSAVEAFSKGGNLTLGGNFTVAAGPVGRNTEGDIAIRHKAAVYTYSKTQGLFAGVSVEGSGLIERKDANKKFYKQEIRAFEILQGDVEPPLDCFVLYDVLTKHQEMFERSQEAELKREARKEAEKGAWQGDGGDSDGGEQPEKKSKSTFITRMKSKRRNKTTTKDGKGKVTKTTTTRVVHYTARSRSGSKVSVGDEEYAANKDEWDNAVTVRALWGFDGQMPCDLSFKAGDEITVLTRTSTQDDWWEGSLSGRIGIFPANYTQLQTT